MFEYPIEIAALANEEACQFKGGVMGSKAMAGVLPLDHAQKTFDEEGHCLYDAMVAFGANPKHLECAVRKKGSIMAFLELHIEQAALLEQKELPVGMDNLDCWYSPTFNPNSWNCRPCRSSTYGGETDARPLP